MTLPNLCPFAQFRPLSDSQTEPRIVPRILMWHTMVGFLVGTERMFKANGYWGTESTYGLGGPWDGAALDGALWQWQGNLWQADAQFEANNWVNSIETSDGGIYPPTPEWSPKQVATSIKLGAWWCKANNVDPVLAKTYDGRGLGYHQLFPQWNQENHNCPGPARVAQLREVIIPGIQKAIGGVVVDPPTTPFPAFPLGAGQYFGPGGTLVGHGLATWQQQMRNRGWAIAADGKYGPITAKTAHDFQAEKGLHVDSLIGRQTWDAAWRTKITR
jgi:peptidoglycan hydrolase-like protein with peptidoglycan-binding domain